MTTTNIFGPGRIVAYFSMEIDLEPDIPTYSGGLGVLAGDLLRASADLGIPMAGVTLVHREGYMTQRLDAFGNQTAESNPWHPEARLERLPATVEITDREIVVSFHRRAHLPIVMASGIFEQPVPVPWWDNRKLRLTTYSA